MRARTRSVANFKLKSQVPKEDAEQMRLAGWLKKNNILSYHCPNGGRRSYVEGCKLKAMGVSPGVPDICVPIARRGYHGLYCELKRKEGGVVSEAQRQWLEALRREGYYVFVSKGADEAIARIKLYMEQTNDQGCQSNR